MKTVLLSTTSLWNCGDEFIREGVLELLRLQSDVRILWWNRGYGIKDAYANDLDINLPLTDYFVVAGSPEWVYKNERIYEYCLKHKVPFSIIGVGTENIFGKAHQNLMSKVAKSGLCEVALARDESAFHTFKKFGFKNTDLILDPAFFMKTLNTQETINILGWRGYFFEYEPSFWFRYPHRWLYGQLNNRIMKRRFWKELKNNYNKSMQHIFSIMPDPKMVIVNDNCEIQEAECIFGPEYVYYSSDYREIFKKYAHAKTYVGSRIHGAIPSLIHGAKVQLIYSNTKAGALETSLKILSKYIPNISLKANVDYLMGDQFNFKQFKETSIKHKAISDAISNEKRRVREILEKQPILSRFIHGPE